MAKKKTEEPNGQLKREKFVSTLKVMLTSDEVAERADRAAASIADRDQKEEEQKAQTKHAKSIIEQIDAEIRLLSQEVRNRSSYQQVECERQWVFSEGMYREIRLDTGEVITERKLLESEKQMELPFEAEETTGVSD